MSRLERVGWGATLLIVGLAAWLRFATLGEWSLDGDEFYSWHDVQKMLAGEDWPHGARSHPLGYLLILLSVSVFGLSEVVVRSAPAVCGLLAVVALLRMRRDVISPRVALAASALAALSPWLIYHAQMARFYSPLLLCVTLATLWALPGQGCRPGRAALAWALAVLCHPTALLLGPGLLAPLFLPPVRWRVLWGLGSAAVLCIALVWFFDGGSTRTVALRAYAGLDPGRYSFTHFLSGLGYNLGPMVGLLALLGLPSAWADRRGSGSTLLLSAGLPPLLLLAISLSGLSVHQRYAMCAVPAALLLAGRGWEAVAVRRPLLGWALAVLAVGAFIPSLVAYQRDGDRHDLRAVAAFLVQNGSSSDIVVADEHATLQVYLHAEPGFADTVVIEESFVDEKKRHDFLRNQSEIWVALKLSRLGSVYHDDLLRWLEESFTEITKVGRVPPPLARHDNRYVIYRRSQRLKPSKKPTGLRGNR
ncbi:MAG: glycosyltransferase family 39 protein [Planctomycetota bacterium]|nr:glycosyltransferase family 39 protein [Planctomycetota bacterium]